MPKSQNCSCSSESNQSQVEIVTALVALEHIIYRPGLMAALLLCSVCLLSSLELPFFAILLLNFICFFVFTIGILFCVFQRYQKRNIAPGNSTKNYSISFVFNSDFPRYLLLFYLVISVICGIVGFRVYTYADKSRAQAENFAGEKVLIEGKVVSRPAISDLSKQWLSADIRLNNGCLVRIYGSSEKLRYGNHISALATMRLPDFAKNPGGFSQVDYLKSKGIWLVGNAFNDSDIKVISEAGFWQPAILAFNLRNKIYQSSSAFLLEHDNNLLVALLLGEDSVLDPAVKIRFRRAGLSHLTSVSGAHVAFLCVPLIAVLKLFKAGRKSSALAKITVLFFYGFLTGWRTGVTRAVIMVVIVLLMQLNNKLADSVNNLGFAAFFMLLLDHNAVYQAGFWLSVLATAALTIISPPLADWLTDRIADQYICFSISCAKTKAAEYVEKHKMEQKRWSFISRIQPFCSILCVVVTMQFCMMPISGRLSGDIFLLSWLVNIPAMLLTSVICTLAIFLLPLNLIITSIFDFLLPLISAQEFLSKSMILVLSFFSRLSGMIISVPLMLLDWLADIGSRSGIRLPYQRLNFLLIGGFFLLGLCFWFSKVKPRKFRIGFNLNIYKSILVFGAGVVILILQIIMQPPWQFYFLDVGQGDSLLMLHKSGKSILVDGGSAGNGYYTILPAMAFFGINKIDLAIMTHAHEDHFGGLIELADLGLIRQMAVPWIFEEQTDYDEMNLFDIVEQKSIPVQFWEKHDTITLFGDAHLRVIAPDRDLTWQEVVSDGNSASLILEFDWQGYLILLLADLTSDMEAKLMSQWRQTDLIKVAHHGSKFTTGQLFIDKVVPEQAVISVGKNNYGHPCPDLIERLEIIGCGIWRTDEDGCITVRLSKQKIIIDKNNG